MTETLLDDTKVKALLANAAIKEEIPQLQTIASALSKGCGSCAAKSRMKTNLNQARALVASLPKEKQVLIKKFFGVSKLVVKVRKNEQVVLRYVL